MLVFFVGRTATSTIDVVVPLRVLLLMETLSVLAYECGWLVGTTSGRLFTGLNLFVSAHAKERVDILLGVATAISIALVLRSCIRLPAVVSSLTFHIDSYS